MDSTAALRPLDEASADTRRLIESATRAELSDALVRVAAAVERSLRVALRSDPQAPEEHRLGALSPRAMPMEEVVRSLRARNRIALETAAGIHELRRAEATARRGEAGTAESDAAVKTVMRLRADLVGLGAAVREPAAPGDAGLPGGGLGGDPPPRVRGSGRWMAWLAGGIAVIIIAGLAWVLAGGGDRDYEAGVAAFRAARWDSAAAAFERVLQERPVDVTTRLYLARVYRRQGRLAEAAEVLREAARVAGDDAGVRRELGHLFMDLGQPETAVRHYDRALEHDPGSPLNWAGLVRALRAMGDPRAEQVLQRAPAEVRAALEAEAR
jgi:tetratricopeptide (TPR) repeat protein